MDESVEPQEGVSRRELLRRVGLGGGSVPGRLGPGPLRGPCRGEPGRSVSAGRRASGDGRRRRRLGRRLRSCPRPPAGIDPAALDAATFPPAPDRRPPGALRELEINVEERLLEIGDGIHSEAWTYQGTVPAPIIRATEGDVLRIRLVNRTGHAHSIHFHGAHRPEMDGWERVPAGAEAVYEIDSGPAGVHPYHCHTAPLAEHVARGLYGMMIVDPPGGRAPATEVSLMLSGFSNDAIGRNGIVAWNGVAGFCRQHPIKVPAGETVRAYVVNMLEYEPIGSFHLHAETFDVYPAGMGDRPVFRDDTIAPPRAGEP